MIPPAERLGPSSPSASSFKVIVLIVDFLTFPKITESLKASLVPFDFLQRPHPRSL